MKLSLSVRVAEKFSSKRKANMTLAELADVAVEEGFHALCMRASQVGTQSSTEEVAEAARMLTARGLACSMVTGDFPIPENSEEGPQALRNIGPYLDLALALECNLLRICMKEEADIEWARRSADEAAERGIRLAHQCHTRSLFELVDRSLEVLHQVNRPNFGLIYEPANLELCGEDFGPETIARFAPHIFNVYLQNHRLNPRGASTLETWARGDVGFDQIPIWETGGIDLRPVFDALSRAEYDGHVTVHQASAALGGGAEAARQSGQFLRTIADFEPPLEASHQV